MKKILALSLALLCSLCLMLTACTQGENETPDLSGAVEDITKDATAVPASDGTMSAENVQKKITLTVDVVDADGNTQTFTVSTDADNLGDALLAEGLVEGEQGAYGLYIKSVNGIRADYDLDKAYWALYSDGELMMTGVSDTAISDGQHYELVYTAG
ncbi:MAG: DUF4430 domain-containing protein [Clostridia bacterium]|nr:DUF4430 domain-containing protein [Clostridia bacterium]